MKNKKLLRAAAALLLVGVVGVASVGCSFEFEQPNWVTQALCDHVFDEEDVLKEATCTEDGRVMKVCTECGKTKITTVKATGHDVVEDEAVAATCTTPGLTAGSHCTACGEVLVKQEEVPAGHTYGEWTVDVAATCTTEGSQKRVCSVCGETETEAIPALHESYDPYETCTSCETVLTPEMLNYGEYKCEIGTPVVGTWFRVIAPPESYTSIGLGEFDDKLYIHVFGEEYANTSFIDTVCVYTPNAGMPVQSSRIKVYNYEGYFDIYIEAGSFEVSGIIGTVTFEITEETFISVIGNNDGSDPQVFVLSNT